MTRTEIETEIHHLKNQLAVLNTNERKLRKMNLGKLKAVLGVLA